MPSSTWLARLLPRARRPQAALEQQRRKPSRWNPSPLRLEWLEERLAPANNITIQNGGLPSIPAGASSFADTNDYTIDPDALNTAASPVILRANVNITFADAVSISGANVGLDAQAFRAINVNAGIATNNSSIILEANQGATPTSGTFYGIHVINATINSGSGTTTLKGRGGDTGDFNIGIAINSGGLVTSTNSVSLTGQGGGSGTSQAGFGIDLTAGGKVAATGSGSVTLIGTGGPGSGNFNSGVLIQGPSSVTTTNGDITITGQGGGSGGASVAYGVSMENGAISAGGAGKVSITATGGAGSGSANVGFTFIGTSSIVTAGGSVSVTGTAGGGSEKFAIATQDAASIATGSNGTITLSGDSMSLASPNSLDAGTGIVRLIPKTTNTKINLGTTSDTIANTLGLSNAELSHITAGILRIGSTGGVNSDITLTAPITQVGAGWTTLSLVANNPNSALISQTNGANLTVTNLNVMSNVGVTLTDPGNAVSQVSGFSGAFAFSLTTTNSLTVGNVDPGLGFPGVTSGSTGGINLTVLGSGNSLTVTNAIQAASGPNFGNVTLTADDMVINNAITANSARSVTLKPATAGRAIDLGTKTAGTLGLSDNELDQIIAGKLVIGSAAAGAITVSADIDLTNTPVIPTLRLTTGSSITGTAGGIVVASLALDAGGVINFTDATTNVTTLSVKTSNDDFTFADTNTVTYGSVDGLTGIDLGTAKYTAQGGTQVLGATTNVGTITIPAGTVKLGASDVIVDSAAINANSSVFDLAGFNETLGQYRGNGQIINSGGTTSTLTLGANDANSGLIGGQVTGAINLVKIGTGELAITNNANNYTGTTDINGGRLLLTGKTGTGQATVNSTGLLDGTGTVAGNLVVASGGTLRPGDNGVGTLAVSGNLTFQTGSTFSVDIGPNASTDLVNVTGAVDIVSGVNLLGTATAPVFGTYKLLSKVTSVAGTGFKDVNGTNLEPSSGGPIVVGGRSFSYAYSSTGFTLTAVGTEVLLSGGDLTVTDTLGGNDKLTVYRSGTDLFVTDPNNILLAGAGVTQVDDHTVKVPFADITGKIQINTGTGNDSVTLNLANGIIPTGGLFFDGGAGGNDKLSVVGSGTESANYGPSATTKGDGTVSVGAGLITFSNLEPIDLTGLWTATVTLPNGDDVIDVANGFDIGGTIPALVVSGTSGGVGIESAHLFNNTFVVIDTSAVDGNDTITITSADNTHGNTNLRIYTRTNSDSLTVNGPVLLPGDIEFFSTTVTVNSSITSSSGGDITLFAANGGVTGDELTLNSDITTSGGSGTISLVSDGDLIQNNAVSAGGAIVAIAASNLTMSATATVFSNGGNIVYKGQAGLAAGSFTTTGSVGLGSTIGNVSDANGAGVNVTAASLVVVAGGGIGDGDALETTVGELAASGKNAVAISDTDSLTIAAVTVAATTNALVTTLGFTGVASAGDITLIADGLLTVSENVTSTATTDGGTITLTGNGGVTINNGAIVTNSGGKAVTIDVTGQGSASQATGILIDGATLSANGGAVSLEGTGVAGTINAIGVLIQAASVVEATGAGTVTILGTGGDGSGGNRGVAVAGATISTADGNLTVEGTGRGSGISNTGFMIAAGVMKTTGLGKLSITGTGGDGTSENDGVLIAGASSQVLTAGGDLSITGTGQGTFSGGVTVQDNSIISAGSTGLVTLKGTGTSSTFGIVFINGTSFTGQTIDIDAGGIDQSSGSFHAENLRVQGTGTFRLLGTNDVGTVAAEVNGTISLANSTGLTVGTVLGTAGITTSDDDVTLCAGTGNLVIANDIKAGTAKVRLQTNAASGGVVSTTGTITASALGVRAGTGGIDLQAGSNAVGTLAVTTTGALLFDNTTNFLFGTVTAKDCFTPTVVGLTVGGDVAISIDTGDMTLAMPIQAAGFTVSLTALAGAILDGNGAANNITAQALALKAATGIGLPTDALEIAVNNLAASNSTSGGVAITDPDGFTVTTVGVVAGVTATGQAISATGAGGSVTLDAGQDLLVNTNIFGGEGDISLTADEMDFAAGSSITGTGNLFLAPQTLSRYTSLGAASNQPGKLSLTATDLAAIGTTFFQVMIGSPLAMGLISVDGNATLTTSALLLQNTGTGAGGLSVNATLNVGTGNLVVVTEGGITSTASGLLQATNLTLEAESGIGTSTDPLFTQVSNLQAETNSGGIYIQNTGALVIGGTSALMAGLQTASGGDIEVSASSPLTLWANVLSSGGDITLTAKDSAGTGDDLTVKPAIQISANGGNIVLQAGDDVFIDASATVQTSGTGTIVLEIDAGNADTGVGGVANFSGVSLQAPGGATVRGHGDADTFHFSPSATTPITVEGNAPLTIPGDTVNLDVQGLPTGTLDITDRFFAELSWTGAAGVKLDSIEEVNPLNGQMNVVLDLAVATLDGQPIEDGSSNPDGVTLMLNPALTDLLFLVGKNGAPATDYFSIAKNGVATTQVLGSNDPEWVVVRNTVGPTAILTEGGNDSIVVAPLAGGLRSGLVGPLQIDAGAGANRLTVNDSSNTQASTVELKASTIAGTGYSIGYAATGGSFQQVSYQGGSGADSVTYFNRNAGSMVVNTGLGNDRIFVRLTPTNLLNGLTVNGGAGRNTLTPQDLSQTALVKNVPTGPGQGRILTTFFNQPTRQFAYQNIAQVVGINAQANYIRSLYIYILGRVATPQEVTYWRGVLATQGRLAVVRALELSPAGRTNLVRQWFLLFKGRSPVGSEGTPLVQALLAGQSEETVLGRLLGNARAPWQAGTRTTLVNYYYRRLLGRAPTATERTQAVNSSNGISQIRMLIEVSNAFFNRVG